MLPSRIFFDDFFDDMDKPRRFENNLMKCDIFEKDGKFNIEMDVPGFKKDDIKMELADGYLTISAEKKNEEKEEKNYIRRERTSYAKCELRCPSHSWFKDKSANVASTSGIESSFRFGLVTHQ